MISILLLIAFIILLFKYLNLRQIIEPDIIGAAILKHGSIEAANDNYATVRSEDGNIYYINGENLCGEIKFTPGNKLIIRTFIQEIPSYE